MHTLTVFGQQPEKMVCCFSSHLQAAKFIGIATLILHSIGLAAFLVMVKGAFGDHLNHGAIGVFGVVILVDFMLIYGSFNKNERWMMAWSIIAGIGTGLFAIRTIWINFTSFVLGELLLGIAITLGNIRAIVTVCMAAMEIEQEQRNAVISISGQEVANKPQIKCIA